MRYDPKIKPEVFASKDTTRMHLVRVQLDCENKMLVATDGHRLIATPVTDCEDDHTGPIDAEVLEASRKVARKFRGDEGATLAANGCVRLPNGVTHLRPGDASDFPPWQRVVPHEALDIKATVCVDSEYLASLFKACGKRRVLIEVRGELDPIVFRMDGDLGETVAVIMPMRR